MTLANLIIVLVIALAIIPNFSFKYRNSLIVVIGIITIMLSIQDNGEKTFQRNSDTARITQLIEGRKLDSIKTDSFKKELDVIYHIKDSSNHPILITNIKSEDYFQLRSTNFYKSPAQFGGSHNKQNITYP